MDEIKLTTEADDDILDALLAMANAHTALMEQMTDEEAGRHIKHIIDTNAAVFAIWPDENHPKGFNIKPVHVTGAKFGPVSAIACPSEEEADQLMALVELHSEHGGRVN